MRAVVLWLWAAALLPSFSLEGQESARHPSRGDLSGVRLLDVPYVAQSEDLCGGAAAAMMMRFWGARGVRAEDFRRLVRPEEGGIRAGELAAALEARGWRAVPFRGDADEVRRQVERGRPVMILLEDRPGRFHYVVIVAWTERGVVLHDPARAPFRVLSRQELRTAWEPSGRWAMLVLPRKMDAEPPARGEALDRGACADEVAEAVERARKGDTAGADVILDGLLDQCPGSASVHVELAGVRAREERWDEAARLSARALELAPHDPWARRLHATSLYLSGARLEALDAWNVLDEPTVDLVVVEGLERTRYRPVRSLLGLRAGRLLTPEALVRGSRRLELLPSASGVRLSYRPVSGGRAEVEAAVVESPVVPRTLPAWGAIMARGFAGETWRVPLVSVAGLGERWELLGRIRENRPRAGLRLSLPDPPLLSGVLSLEVSWERQSYAEAGSLEDGLRVEERRWAAFSVTDWASGRLRWEGGGMVERWAGGSTDLSLTSGLELRDRGETLSLLGRTSLSESVSAGAGGGYGVASLRARWRSTAVRTGTAWHLRAGVDHASSRAPRARWPGAGNGNARDVLLRAHALTDDGIVSGPVFGRTLAHGGAAVVRWLPPGLLSDLAVLRVGAGAFVDLARPWQTVGDRPEELQVDVGVGLRIALPGQEGTLRLEGARDLLGGGWGARVGWSGAWPAW